MIEKKYEYKPYPKFLYHKSKDPVIVQSEEDQKDLGRGWHEEPVKKSELKTLEDEQDHDS